MGRGRGRSNGEICTPDTGKSQVILDGRTCASSRSSSGSEIGSVAVVVAVMEEGGGEIKENSPFTSSVSNVTVAASVRLLR